MVENLIFDVGLHRGEDADYYLAKGFTVVGFEADPSSVAFCQKRFSRQLANGQLKIESGAIAPGDVSTVTFFVNDSMSLWGTIHPAWVARNTLAGTGSSEITVPRTDIASCFKKYGVPHYLKIDIEGADRYVLETLKSLDEKPKFVSMESEKVNFDDLLLDIETLSALGYQKFKVVQQEGIPGTVISTLDLNGKALKYKFQQDASGPFGSDLEGSWLTKEQAIKIYRRIFLGYRLFGDYSFLRRHLKLALRLGAKVSKQPLPGWHDLHASLDEP